jgi:hypothetical protein
VTEYRCRRCSGDVTYIRVGQIDIFSCPKCDKDVPGNGYMLPQEIINGLYEKKTEKSVTITRNQLLNVLAECIKEAGVKFLGPKGVRDVVDFDLIETPGFTTNLISKLGLGD